jgi:hypothetical protein
VFLKLRTELLLACSMAAGCHVALGARHELRWPRDAGGLNQQVVSLQLPPANALVRLFQLFVVAGAGLRAWF